MVAITSAMAFFASGIFFRGFTVFVPAIRDSLGISQAQTNLIFSIARAEGGLEGPVAGWLIDRFGNRKLLIPAILLAVAGYPGPPAGYGRKGLAASRKLGTLFPTPALRPASFYAR